MAPSIALIHATYNAIPPVEQSFTRLWPEAETTSLLAEDLTHALSKAGEQTPEIAKRIKRLAEFALDAGVHGILYTCSAFGEAIEAVQKTIQIPVLKPNEAMFETALDLGDHIGMLVTFEPAVQSMTDEFNQMAQANGRKTSIDVHYIPGALEALSKGDAEAHHHFLAEAAAQLPRYDVLMLAQFSMSDAKAAVESAADTKVLTSPESAIQKLKLLVDN